jgi:ferritin
MVKQNVVEKLIEQVKHEWESEFYYLAMMAWCYNNDFDGFGDWFQNHAGEEREHGMRIVRYISEVGGRLSIPSVSVPRSDFDSLEQLFQLTLEHEEKVTGLVHELANLAQKEGDHTTHHFLQWYINEQIEEEAMARNILAKVRRAQGNPSALLIIESKLTEGLPAPAAGGGASVD